MERRVIQQNLTTLVFSLPKKWTIRNDIKKGDKITIVENPTNLIISKKNNMLNKTINIESINEFNKRTATIILNDLYRKGYDEINIIINEDHKKIIKEILQKDSQLFGFEILNEEKNKILLSSFAEPKNENFEKLLLKIILIIKENLKKIDNIDISLLKTAEKYAQFLRRQAIKEGKNQQYEMIFRTLVLISHSLERIRNANKKIDKDIIIDINELFELTYEKLFYNKTSLLAIQKKYSIIENKIISKKIDEGHLHLWEILRNLSFASSAIFSLNNSIIE